MSSLGVFVLAYIDNLLVVAPTVSLCAEHLQTVLRVLADHGWIVNERKSRLTPSQSLQCLGLHWDLDQFQYSLPDLTQVRIYQSIDMLLTQPMLSRRQVMQAQGFFKRGARTDHSVRPLMPVMRRELARTRCLLLDFQFPPPLTFRLGLASLRNERFIPLHLVCGLPLRFWYAGFPSDCHL